MCKRYAHKYVNNAAMLYSVTFRLRPKPYSITKHFCNLFIHHSMQSLFKKTKKKLIHLTSYENCEVDQWSGLCWVCSNGSATAVQVCHSFSLPLYFSHTHTDSIFHLIPPTLSQMYLQLVLTAHLHIVWGCRVEL